MSSTSVPHSLILDTDNDIEKLIERTEQEGDQEEPERKEGFSFSFAKIWSADKDALEEVPDETAPAQDQDDSWSQTLAVRSQSLMNFVTLFQPAL